MKIIELENPDGTTTELVEIETSEGHFTQMPKSVYDAQVEHLTEIPTV